MQHRVVEQADADALALAPAVLSLNCVIRRSSPMYVMVLRIHMSSLCAGTWLCTKTMERSGSTPAGEEQVDQVDGVAPQLRAHLPHRDGVQVDGAVQAVVGLLHGDPVLMAPR